MSCEQCSLFPSASRLSRPAEYLALAVALDALVEQGKLRVLSQTCPLDQVQAADVWVDDIIEHSFVCSVCGQRFLLSVETYHGSGGFWGPV